MERFPKISIITCVIEPACTQFIIPFLESIYESKYLKNKLEVIIQNNGMTQRSLRNIRQRFAHVKIIGDGKNLNFAKGINVASQEAHGIYFFITNVDTVVDGETFKELIRVLGNDQTIGIVGPRVYQLRKKNTISNRDLPIVHFNRHIGSLVPLTFVEDGKFQTTSDVEWISGCGFLTRRTLWQKLHGFDEKFIAYWEDADLGLRLRKLGLRVTVAAKAKMWHYGSIVHGQDSPTKIYHLMRSYLYFSQKHLFFGGWIWTSLYVSLVCLVKVVKIIVGQDPKTQAAYIQAVKDHYFGRVRNYETKT